MQKLTAYFLAHRKPYLRAWIIKTWQKKSLLLIASNCKSIQVFLRSRVHSQHWTFYCKLIKFQFFNIQVLNHAQAILTSSSLWILFRETQASVSPFNTQGKAFNGPISIFSRAILVKTWKQKFCTNIVKIPVCKNIINAYRITEIRICRLDIIASIDKAYLQQFLSCLSPQGRWWRNLQRYTFW